MKSRPARSVLSILFPVLVLFFGSINVFEIGADQPAAHRRHEFRHGDDLPKEPISEARFSTSRETKTFPQLPGRDDSFNFVVLGDRTSGQDSHVAILADAVRDINLFEPDLVMNVGDMVQGYNTTDLWTRQMKEFKDIMGRLKCPWFPTVGNHDVYWRGPDQPKFQHEDDYELHFGPLWYAFEHKNCWFIVLFTDEGDRTTGRKGFSEPELQRMSPEQFRWLETTLEKTKDADQVFVFQHQPRWQNQAHYGNDWDRVHDLFVKAGNVSAVFAGHTHTMRYEKRDGIEYFTLSTTGGRFDANGIPGIGFRDNYLILNVRNNRLGVASFSVSDAVDPRSLDPVTTGALRALHAGLKRTTTGPIVRLAADGAVDAKTVLNLKNTSPFPVEVRAILDSRDSRWRQSDYPTRIQLEPGAQQEFEFKLVRPGLSVDEAFRPPFVKVDLTALTPGAAIPIPTVEVPVPLELKDALEKTRASKQAVLEFRRDTDLVRLPSVTNLQNLKGLTLETWFRADAVEGRRHLASKGFSAELSLTLNGGVPVFQVPITDRAGTALAAPKEIAVKPGAWHHLAGVFDGTEMRIYLDGKLVAKKENKTPLPKNLSPVILGTGIDRDGIILYGFKGALDSIRLSGTARYRGERFEPARDFVRDKKTLFLLDMQESVGRLVPFHGKAGQYGKMEGDCEIVPLSTAP